MIAEPSNLPATSQETPYGVHFPSAEEEEPGAGFTLLQVWYMLRAHLWLSFGAFVLLMGLAYIGIKHLPKSYDATAALIVNADNADPLAGRNYSAGQSGTFFPTQMELIYNSVMLLPVIDRLKLQNDSEFNGGFVGDPKTLNDVVLGNLRSGLGVKQGAGSQLLYISMSARDPVKAANIANAVAEEYLSQSRERINAPAIEKAERYSAQMNVLKANVDAATTKVTEFRERYGMTDLKDGPNDSEGVALQDLENRLLEAKNARRQLEARVGATGTDGASADGQEVVALRGELATLERQLTQQRTTLGPNYPSVIQLAKEVESKRGELQAGVSTALARAREMENNLQAAKDQEVARSMDRLVLRDQGNKLVLELQTAKDTYTQALRGLDQIKFASTGDYKDVTLVSRAEPAVRASKPNKLKYFAAAFLASFGLALGGPFAYELLIDRRIRCRDDLERSFRTPMLAQFGPMSPTPAS